MTARRSVVSTALQLPWEVARFLGLFLLLFLRFRTPLVADPAAVLWLVAWGSPQLLVPAGLAIFLLSPRYRATLLPFLRLAKILQVFPVVALAAVLPFTRGLPRLPFLLTACVVDVLFLYLLFARRNGPEEGLP
jgi:hypothetical protein